MSVALPSTTANATAKGGSSYAMTRNGFVDKNHYTEIHASIEKMMDDSFIRGCHPWMNDLMKLTDDTHGRTHYP